MTGEVHPVLRNVQPNVQPRVQPRLQPQPVVQVDEHTSQPQAQVHVSGDMMDKEGPAQSSVTNDIVVDRESERDRPMQPASQVKTEMGQVRRSARANKGKTANYENFEMDLGNFRDK